MPLRPERVHVHLQSVLNVVVVVVEVMVLLLHRVFPNDPVVVPWWPSWTLVTLFSVVDIVVLGVFVVVFDLVMMMMMMMMIQRQLLLQYQRKDDNS